MIENSRLMRRRIYRKKRENEAPSVPATGNRAIQAKLEIGQPNDKYEKEADAVADRVTKMPNHSLGGPVSPIFSNSGIQMKCAACEKEESVQRMAAEEEEKVQMQVEEEEEQVQMKAEEEEDKIQMQPEEEEEKVQMKPAVQRSGDGTMHASPAFAGKLRGRQGLGQALPNPVSRELSHKIGADFSHVHIHTDSHAIQMNQQLGAQAFTHGNDIYFNKGKYDPGSSEGKHLLAHELTHVVQQKADEVIRQKPIHDYFHKGDDACACLVHVHNDERNSKAVADFLHSNCNYNLVDVKDSASDSKGRNLKKALTIIDNKGKTARKKDPNEIFSPEIIKTCSGGATKKKTSKDEVCAFYNDLKKCSKDFGTPVVALHNNTKLPAKRDPLTESTNIHKWGGSKAIKKVAKGDMKNPDRVVWTSNPQDYKKLEGEGSINVALQDENFKGDTDLSTLFNFIPDLAVLENESMIKALAIPISSQLGLPTGIVEIILKNIYSQYKKQQIRYVNIETEHKKNKYDQSLAEMNLNFAKKVLTALGIWCCDDSLDLKSIKEIKK